MSPSSQFKYRTSPSEEKKNPITPKSRLKLKKEEEMGMSSSEKYDMIIIGAGIMGSCTAYHAAKQSLRVLLLEQFDFLHHLGSSHGESRTIRYTYPEPYYIPLTLQSFHLFKEAETEIGYKVLTETPHFDLGPSTDKSLQSVIVSCTSHSIPFQITNQSSTSEIFRNLLHLPDDWIGLLTNGGVIKPTKAVAMFQSLAVKHGAVLKDHVQVTNIKKNGDCDVVISTNMDGEFYCSKCVITAGAWTRKLVDVPIQPLHTLICYWKVKEGYKKKLSAESGFPTFASYGHPYIYGTPSMEFPGLIKIAMHAGQACDLDRREWGSGMGTGLDSLVEGGRKWIEKVMPECVDSEKPVMVQGCMYSMTSDGDFVVDYVGGELGKDVVMGGGFSGHGFKMGPVIGKILVDMAVKGEVEEEVGKWFGLSRFVGNPKGNVKEYDDQVSSSHVDC